ncbi:MAG: tetratricopeptide (TPR) repeat protein [Rhodothermales bacterium]|jgi:tetratricopeptide (TPR) repeat protein
MTAHLRLLAYASLVFLISSPLLAQEMEWKPESTWRKGKQSSVASHIRKAEIAEERGNYKDAAKLYRKIQSASVNLRNQAKALIAQGRCLELLDKPYRAYECYAQAVDRFASFIPFSDVLARELDIANDIYYGKKEEFLWVIKLSNYDRAIEIYDHIAKSAPYGDQTPEATYRAGLLNQREKFFEDAISRFEDVLNKFPTHDRAIDARIDLANTLLLHSAQADGDGALVKRARRELEYLKKRAPDHARSAEIDILAQSAQEMEAARLLYLGEFYQRDAHQRLGASQRYLREVMSEYDASESKDAAGALLTAINMHVAVMDQEAALEPPPVDETPQSSGPPAPVGVPEVEPVSPPEAPEPPPVVEIEAPSTAPPVVDSTEKPGLFERFLRPITQRDPKPEVIEKPEPKYAPPATPIPPVAMPPTGSSNLRGHQGRWLRPIEELDLGGEEAK